MASGKKVGIWVGVIFGVLLMGTAVWFFLPNRKKKTAEAPKDPCEGYPTYYRAGDVLTIKKCKDGVITETVKNIKTTKFEDKVLYEAPKGNSRG